MDEPTIDKDQQPTSKVLPLNLDEQRSPINIVVCSDGTGNSDVKNRGTNVFKLYEMIDVSGHLNDPSITRQVAIYDDGIGTQSSKYISAIAGAFGFGLKRNIRQLYIALSRVYRPGDRIYMFGFSRGAFTIRALSGLVNAIGLIKSPEIDTPGIWQKRASAAQREFRDQFLFRALLQYIISRIVDPIFNRTSKYNPDDFVSSGEGTGVDVQFVGVWDTVDAVGFPLAGVSEFWNEVIYRFKFTEYGISDRVKHGAHALAIDDQRRTFWPLLWNEREAHETDKTQTRDHLSWWRDIKKNTTRWLNNQILMLTDLFVDEYDPNAATSRAAEIQARAAARLGPDNPSGKSNIQQTWFSGMHSNVGGGYPRQGMSLVSLDWMLKQAHNSAQADRIPPLRLNQIQHDDLQQRISVTDKMYDSRSGGALFYRFSPRRIQWLCRANACPVEIHPSVYERARNSSDPYAPGNLPVNKLAEDLNVTPSGDNAFLVARRYDFLRKVIQRVFYVVLGTWIVTTLSHRTNNSTQWWDWIVEFGNAIATISHSIILGIGFSIGGLNMLLGWLLGDAWSVVENLFAGLWSWLQASSANLVKLLPGGEWVHANLVTPAFENPPLLSALVVGFVLIIGSSSMVKRRSNALLLSEWSRLQR